MNKRHTELYENLMALSLGREAFFHKDFTGEDGVTYRIFNYRLASYTDFLEPDAMECRGVMFVVDGETPVRLASLPFAKFFNMGENPFTMGEDMDPSLVRRAYYKEDGSLMSTYLDANGELCLKSKGSIASEQCIDAMEFLGKDAALRESLLRLARLDICVMMEWVAPHNRIVLGYDEPDLMVIGARNMLDMEEVFPEDICDCLEVTNRWVLDALPEQDDVADFIKSIPDMKNIEGFVLVFESGQRVKMKTSWYLTRHKLKDSINSRKHLYEAVVYEATDDMKVMFGEDAQAMARIEEMERVVIPAFNRTVSAVEAFYKEHGDKDRKDYAIAAQGLSDGLMPLYMNLYLGRENDYKEFFCKKQVRERIIGASEDFAEED